MAAVFGTTAKAAILAARAKVAEDKAKFAAAAQRSPIYPADIATFLTAIETLLTALEAADDTS